MELHPISSSEFELYLASAVKKYEEEMITIGMPEKQASIQAKQSFERLLPEGIITMGRFLCNAYDGNQKVGFIWYGIRSKITAFIYDFYIEEAYQRQGYGTKVMLECEKAVKDKGLSIIDLHVFGHNIGARKLYESLDYHPTSIQMRKNLI